MPMCKILENYDNAEKWSKDQIVEITNPAQLIKEGKVRLVNEKGEEIAPPGAPMKCPICFYEGKDPVGLANHILANHSGKPEVQSKSTDALKQQRLDNLEKARAARKLNQVQKNVDKKQEEADKALKEALEATKG